MADSSSSIHRITPLQGSSNYSSWKVQMLDVLTDLTLEDYVETGATAPDESNAKEHAKWTKADRRALSAIRLRVASDVVQHIQGEKTALGAWEMLSHLFELKGKSGLVLARHRFYGTRANYETKLEAHIKMMRQLQGELIALGDKVEDTDFSVALLSSLHADWDAFSHTILSLPKIPDSKTTISMLLTEERRRTNRDPDSEDSATGATAMMARSRIDPARIQHQKTRFMQLPPTPPASASTTAPAQLTWQKHAPVCHTCGGKGHFSRVCPSRPEFNSHAEQINLAVAEDTDAESDTDEFEASY